MKRILGIVLVAAFVVALVPVEVPAQVAPIFRQASPPTCSGCGANHVVTGSDTAFRATITGSGAQPYTFTFRGTYNAAPSCHAQVQATLGTTGYYVDTVYASTTSVVVRTNGTKAQDQIAVLCFPVQ